MLWQNNKDNNIYKFTTITGLAPFLSPRRALSGGDFFFGSKICDIAFIQGINQINKNKNYIKYLEKKYIP